MIKFELFKIIDEAIFEKLDYLQNHPRYIRMTDAYSNLEENIQDLIKAALMLIVTIVPILISMIFISSNSSLKEKLIAKEQIMDVANELIQKRSLVTSQGRKILGPTYVDSEGSLKNKISSLLSMSSIEMSKVNINNFDSEELDGYITKVKADVGFKDLSSQDIFAAFNSLTARGKMRIDEVSIRKSESDNLLDGMMTLIYYSKDNSTE